MSELAEKRWAVISERGAEESGLTYAEAHELVRRLVAEGLHGLSIITAEAAHRIARRKSASEPVPDRV